MQRTNSNLKKSPNPSILLPKQLDILHECAVPIDQDFIFTLTKDIKEKIDKDARRTCKILKFTSNWDADDILAKIYKLDPKNFPNLFIFIIEVKNVDRFEASRITEKLIKFGKNRPIILQINSDDEVPVDDRKTKLLYKEENSNEFMDTKGKKVATTKNFYNFSTFLWLCMNEKQENLEKKVLKKLQKIKNSSLILKFLRVLKLSEQFFNDLVLKYAAQGLKSDFLITVDGFINDKGKFDFLDTKLITNTLIDYKSALFVAIQHSNKEVTDFIIKKCTILIQELPFEHQIEISEAALSTNQINVLCDLLTIADFPFPDDLKDLGLRKDPRLSRIIAERIKFHRSIMAENMAEITKFITENPNIKFAYNVKNKSALNQSQRSAKFETFFLLKSNRFRSNEIENFDENLDEDEFRSKARTLASVQRKENVDNSTPDKDKSVLLLATRSFIYNRGNENQVEEEQREKIRKWFKDINNTRLGSKLIDVASQCNDLKIIFDFECDSVENIDVSKTQSTQGTTYPKSKWIFIGAKLTEDIKREQEIKGVIAHEICHLVMRLVFQNNEFPYSKDNIEASKKFDAIVNEIESMLFPPQEGKDTVDAAEDEEEEYFKSLIEELGIDNNKDNSDNSLVDDECDGIISSVYSSYGKSDYHVELIVRPVQIQTQFDDDPEKVAKLEEKYKNLFEFCIRVIIPELVKFNLKQRGNVENFNNFVGFSTEIRNLDIELRQTQDLASMMESKLVILSSNVPKLLKLNIYKFLFDKYGDLLEFQNIFIDPKCLENYFIRNNLKEILQEQKDLNIFVDCSNGFIDVSEFITSCEDSRIIVIASNDKCYTELRRKMKELKLDPQKLELNYSWTDLTKESQKKLLSTKINFQNNSDLSLYELIFGGFNETGQELADFADIVDDKLMNLLLEKSTIHLNIYPKENRNDLSFKILFQSRKLVKSFQNYNFVMPNNSIKIEIEKPGGTLARSILNTQYNNRQSILMLNEMIPPLSEETEPKYSKILPANIEVVDMCCLEIQRSIYFCIFYRFYRFIL